MSLEISLLPFGFKFITGWVTSINYALKKHVRSCLSTAHTLAWQIAMNLPWPGLITIFILYELKQFVINIWPVCSSVLCVSSNLREVVPRNLIISSRSVFVCVREPKSKCWWGFQSLSQLHAITGANPTETNGDVWVGALKQTDCGAN